MDNKLNRSSIPAFGAILIAALVWQSQLLRAADAYTPFTGEKTTWHDGFDRYDFIMDDASLSITPMTAPANEVSGFGIDESLKNGQRRCVVIVPKTPAPGNPWAWQGCYWNHQPQAEVELLHRGFHVAFIAPDPIKQGKPWDAWYAFLTGQHGLSKTPAFVGMSKGGVNAYDWAVANPDKVSCIYGDNPAIYPDDFAQLAGLAKNDVPLLNICGSLDYLYQSGWQTISIEDRYLELRGRITVMIKEGTAHHPHSLINPKPIADWIEQNMKPSGETPPEFIDNAFLKSHYYSLENSYVELPEEHTYATCRGPGYTPCYDRYDDTKGGSWGITGMAIILPKTSAPGKPWVFRADRIERDCVVDQALLAKGFHIVIAPLTGQPGPSQKEWDTTYQFMIDHGFSKKPVMEGTGAAAGEAYAWAILNPDKVSCIFAENPVMRTLTMSKTPLLDQLAPLAQAGVPLIHDCGSLDPWLATQTRVVEQRYKALGGQITVILKEGAGHFPLQPADPKPIVEFILSHSG